MYNPSRRTNIDDGPVLGRTITTDTRTGNLLVALLAVLSTLGTAHLWHLLAFAIHQVRANGQPRDALFRQQQALLRTLPTPSSVMADVLKLWWAWRKHARRPLLRSIGLVLLAFLFATATIAASVFSSLIVDGGSITVLVDSPFCGKVNPSGRAWQSYKVALENSTPTYAKDCYKNASLPSTCNVFVHPSVPFTVQDAPCPFNASMCVAEKAVSMDSGLVDVSKAFGLNLAARDRISYRRRATCTVLPSQGHTAIFNLTELPQYTPSRGALPGEQVVAINFGRTNDPSQIASFVASLTLSNVSATPNGRNFYTNVNNTEPPGIIPIRALFNPDGDTMFKVFMPNSVAYDNPVDDPLFSAHKKLLSYDDTQLKNDTIYMSDFLIKGIGCLQQVSKHISYANCNFPEANEIQRALLQLIVFSSYLYDFAHTDTCQASSLIKRADARIESLPDDQWKQEVVGWEKETWAALQILVSQYAIGPKVSDPLADNYWIHPETRAEKTLCGAQKMTKSGDFVRNINVFGLSFVIAFSIMVSVLDIMLLKFLVYLSSFRRALAPRIDRWIQDGVWQLQRRAYEGEGHRDWKDLESEIPLMHKDQKLKDLSITWLPGKSPGPLFSSTFNSGASLEPE
ncbi:hypothetical protein BKA66DRAFT_423129 [Pyrenochaeta sp. MPI-SDFR-AT-0127]|nr:hypothetical protein BKA66DRAFT_423129 [Pyrenochaeta sp. MPI-SDFR-AT-0127]